jgi:two-component system, OmpR family, response regulator
MAGARRRILVVEDDPMTAEQLADSLATDGYQVDLAADGNTALGRGRSTDYVVMTIDRMLPGLDGITVIRQLREDGDRHAGFDLECTRRGRRSGPRSAGWRR